MKKALEQVRGMGYLPQDTDAIGQTQADKDAANKEMYVVHMEEKKFNQSTPSVSAFTNKPYEKADDAWVQLKQFGVNQYNKLKSTSATGMKYEIKQSGANADKANAYILIYGYENDKVPETIKQAKYYLKIYMKKSKYYNAGGGSEKYGKKIPNAASAAGGQSIVDEYIIVGENTMEPRASTSYPNVNAAMAYIKNEVAKDIQIQKQYYAVEDDIAKDPAADKGKAVMVYFSKLNEPFSIYIIRGTAIKSEWKRFVDVANTRPQAPADTKTAPAASVPARVRK